MSAFGGKADIDGFVVSRNSSQDLRRDPRNSAPQQSKITALYNGPFPRLRSLLCLAERSFPLFVGVVLNAAVLKDRVSDFEFSMRFAIEPSCIPSTIKLMHCGLADRAKEGPGQRSILANGSRLSARSLALQGTS